MKDLKKKLLELNKKYPNSPVLTGKELGERVIERVSSGSMWLDYCLHGGFPRGRVTEIYGPPSSGKSLISLRTIANAQRQGLDCILVDAEQAFDAEHAAKLGVDTKKLIVVAESGGERVFDIVLDLLDTKPAVVVIDSVASLIPEVEESESIEKQTMALQARLMSKAMRKLTMPVARSNTCLIFINQIREKVGCLNYNSRVTLGDGTTEKIGKIVNSPDDYDIVTYNEHTKVFEVDHGVIRRFRNGTTDTFLQIRARKHSGNGRSNISCTPNHNILTPTGYKRADEIAPGDRVIQMEYRTVLSDVQREIIMGSLLGDGSIRDVKEQYQYRETHAHKQRDYLLWKASHFHRKTVTDNAHYIGFESFLSKDFEPMYRDFYRNRKKRVVPSNIVLTPLVLAIWYMDDGSRGGDANAIDLYTNRFDLRSVKLLVAKLRRLGIEGKVVSRRSKYDKLEHHIRLSRAGTLKYFDICGGFIHPSMMYKLPNISLNGIGASLDPSPHNHYEVTRPIVNEAEVVDVRIKPKTRSMQKFDIGTHNHNYLADGVVVHNSYGNPEVTSGGRALAFYSSVRLEVRRGDFILLKDSDEEPSDATADEKKRKIGHEIRFKVTKSKVSKPWQQGSFDYYYRGIVDEAGEIMSLLEYTRKVVRRGAYYDLLGETYQGRTAAVKAIRADKKIRDAILKMLNEEDDKANSREHIEDDSQEQAQENTNNS